MGDIWRLSVHSGRVVSAVREDASGRRRRETGPLWTVADFCRRTGKSRRQIYRDIRAGRIRPLVKLLDTWLVEPVEVARLKPPPASMASLFPEYDAGTLDLERDRDTVLARVLRFGGADRLRWAFSFYGAASVQRFVLERGAALLELRSRRFWLLYFGLPCGEEARLSLGRAAGSRRRKPRGQPPSDADRRSSGHAADARRRTGVQWGGGA